MGGGRETGEAMTWHGYWSTFVLEFYGVQGCRAGGRESVENPCDFVNFLHGILIVFVFCICFCFLFEGFLFVWWWYGFHRFVYVYVLV